MEGRRDLKNQVAPEGVHVAGGLLGRWRDEEDFRRKWWFGRGIGFRRTDDSVGDEGGLAAGFVGVETLITDGLLTTGGRWSMTAAMKS
jgi:hypothetical protein